MNLVARSGETVRNLWQSATAAARGMSANLSTWRRGLALVVMAAPRIVVVYLTLVVVISLVPVLQVWLLRLLVDGLAVAAAVAEGSASTVLVLAVLYALTYVIPAGLEPIQRTLNVWLEDRAVAATDRRLMDAGIRLTDLIQIERPAFQDRLRLVQEAIFFLPRLIAYMQMGLGTALTLGGMLLLLARLHPILPVILVVLSAPHFFGEKRQQDVRYQSMVDRSRAAREMRYCARITTEPAAAKEIRVFGLGDFFLGRFRSRFAKAYEEMRRVRLSHLRVSAAFTGLHALALAGGFWYVAVQARAGQLTLGDIALYLGVVTQTQSRLQDLVFWFGFQYEILLHLRGLFSFLDQAKPAIALPPPQQGRPAPTENRRGIELQAIHFRYPEGTLPVLKEISARLPHGAVTALVGANGAGKSTLVKLLTRMYDPDSGEIHFDGVPISMYDLQSLRGRIAVLYQDFTKFALTLRENIELGAVEPGEDGLRVEEAARWSGADEVAGGLPQGLDTLLTRRFQGGVELSGGDWQKVALARAFVRSAALVILDEPTAALDAEAEYRLFERFRQLVAGKTALIISHRFSTVRMADHILVLENGRISEAGSHAELVSLGGRYAELFEMQAGRYRN